jgi:hypothetical protein
MTHYQKLHALLSRVLKKCVVDEAVQPFLPRLGGSDDGMTIGASVTARVLVGRGIAAERHAARLTGAQMDPARAGLHAFGALAPLRLLHVLDGVDMCAGFSHIGQRIMAG